MKFYVTGRSNNYERVKAVFTAVKERGHEVTFEWTTLPMAKPYAENQDKAKQYSVDGIQGVVDADVYIIFVHEDGNGVYTEFGAALATNAIKGTPAIYAVGKEQQGAAMFNYHPAITWCDSIEEVFKAVL